MADSNHSMAPLSPVQIQALLNGPAGTPPPGVVPNFNHPESLNAVTVAVVVLTITFSMLAVTARVYTKVYIIRSLALEDYLILAGLIAQVGESIPAVLVAKEGAGTHAWNVKLENFLRMLYYVNLTGILYVMAIAFIKLSILTLYLRVLVPNREINRTFFVSVWCVMTVNSITYASYAILLIAQCVPREKIWNPFLAGGHCIDVAVIYKATAIFNILSDFTILILPMPIIWTLQIQPAKKVGLTAVFATGLFACITSILRTYWTWKVYETPDLTWNVCFLGYWTAAEQSMGIFVSCMPSFPKLFQSAKPNIHALFSRFTPRIRRNGPAGPPAHTGSLETPGVPRDSLDPEIGSGNLRKSFAGLVEMRSYSIAAAASDSTLEMGSLRTDQSNKSAEPTASLTSPQNGQEQQQ